MKRSLQVQVRSFPFKYGSAFCTSNAFLEMPLSTGNWTFPFIRYICNIIELPKTSRYIQIQPNETWKGLEMKMYLPICVADTSYHFLDALIVLDNVRLHHRDSGTSSQWRLRNLDGLRLTYRVAPALPFPDRRGGPSGARSTVPSASVRAWAPGGVAYFPVERRPPFDWSWVL